MRVGAQVHGDLHEAPARLIEPEAHSGRVYRVHLAIRNSTRSASSLLQESERVFTVGRVADASAVNREPEPRERHWRSKQQRQAHGGGSGAQDILLLPSRRLHWETPPALLHPVRIRAIRLPPAGMRVAFINNYARLCHRTRHYLLV